MKMRTQKKLNIRDERGFTIVEVLVSLIIFSIAVTGVITVAVQGGLNVNQAKLNLTATYLADEGVELMRALRDTSVVNSGGTAAEEAAGWAAFTSVANSHCKDSPCDIDPTIASVPFPSVSNIQPCATFCPLFALPDGGYTDIIGVAGATPTPYSRKILVTPRGADDMQVTVTVTYQLGTMPSTVTQTEDIFNWYNP